MTTHPGALPEPVPGEVRRRRSHGTKNPKDRPEDVVMAWVKRQLRLPLNHTETAWLVGVHPNSVGEVERRALAKIRAELEKIL